MPGTTDTVKAKLTPGEFVIRKEAVDAIGVPMLNMLNNIPKEGGHSAIDKIIDANTNAGMKMMYGGGMVNPNYAGGGSVQQYGHGGSVNKMMGYENGGMANKFKPVPNNNPGLGKLPEMVRNRMGYMNQGGMVNESLMGMMHGGMAKKKKMMGYQDGGQIPKDDPLQIGRRMKMGASALPTGIGMARQPEDPLQIEMRMQNPSVYDGGVIGAVRNQANALNQGMIQDTVNRARKALELLKLQGVLNSGEAIESDGNMEGLMFPDKMIGKRKMSETLQMMPYLPK